MGLWFGLNSLHVLSLVVWTGARLNLPTLLRLASPRLISSRFLYSALFVFALDCGTDGLQHFRYPQNTLSFYFSLLTLRYIDFPCGQLPMWHFLMQDFHFNSCWALHTTDADNIYLPLTWVTQSDLLIMCYFILSFLLRFYKAESGRKIVLSIPHRLSCSLICLSTDNTVKCIVTQMKNLLITFSY